MAFFKKTTFFLPFTLYLLTFTYASLASAATYYIDYANGSDSNGGTSQGAPWQRHPFMNGFSGAYAHQSGDRFIFKGGVTWPNSVFQMNIDVAGASNTSRDYYGVDTSWFNSGCGASFCRPVFDGQNLVIGPGPDDNGDGTMVLVKASNLTFDNIEFKNLLVGSANRGGAAFIGVDSNSNITLQNSYLHGWDQVSFGIKSITRDANGLTTVTTTQPNDFFVDTAVQQGIIVNGISDNSFNTICGFHCGWIDQVTTIISPTQFSYKAVDGNGNVVSGQPATSSGGTVTYNDDAHGALEAGGPTSNLLVDHCIISNTEFSTTHNSGVAVHQWNTIQNNTIHDVSSNLLGVANVISNVMYDLGWPVSSYDPTYHTNGIYQIYGGTLSGNLIYNFAENAAPFYPNPEADNSTCGSHVSYIYNNVFKQSAGPSVYYVFEVDPWNGSSGSCSSVYIWNNTVENAAGNAFMRIVGSPRGTLNTLVMQNNHYISGGTFDYCLGGGCGSATHTTNTNNLGQTISSASGQGYTTGDNYAPGSSASITVGAGTNLTAIGLAALDFDKIGTSRPATGVWDAGAYNFTGSTNGGSTDIYITQNSAGSADGSSCANAKDVGFFNNALNWGASIGQIGPGTTVHLCGTFDAPAGSSGYLNFQGSGTAGNPIRLLFEPGAILETPYWGIGAITATGSVNYITVDGGANGLVQATANGTNQANQQDGKGVVINGNNIIITNLTVANLYVHANDLTDENGLDTYGIDIAGSHMTVSNCTIHDTKWAVRYTYPTGTTQTDFQMDHNSIYNIDHGLFHGDGNSGSTFTNARVYANDIHDFANWDDNANNNHHDGLHFNAHPNSSSKDIKIYNNYIHGDPGNHNTAYFFTYPDPNGVANLYIFNNLFVNDSTDHYLSNGFVGLVNAGTSYVVNNTMVSKVVGPVRDNGIIYDPTSSGITAENNIISNTENAAFYSPPGASITTLDFNNLYQTGGWYLGGTWYSSLASVQNLGYENNSSTSNPILDSGYKPQNGSPVLRSGSNLSGFCTIIPELCSDKSGASRPGNGSWDMGAFQISSGAGSLFNIYIAQTTAGSADGSSCANAKDVGFFNNPGNWSTGTITGLIGPGTTVHLCGTLTGTPAASILMVQGSGTANAPITIKWEPGAFLTSPVCGGNACLDTMHNAYLILDGNGNQPTITATDNGTQLGHQLDSGGISAQYCNGCEIKNQNITNMYVFVGPDDRNEMGGGIGITGSSNIRVHDNSFDQMASPISDGFGNGDNNLFIYNNTFDHFNHGVEIGNNNSNVISNVYIYGNHGKSMANWDTTNDYHHHDGIFFYQNTAVPNTVRNFYVYNNLFDGDPGVDATAWVYFNSGLNGIYVFNNIFKNPAARAFFLLEGGYPGDQNIFVENNFFDCGGSTGPKFSDINGLTFQSNALTTCYTYLFADRITNPSVNHNVYANFLDDHNGHCNTMKWDNHAGICYDQYRSANPGLDVNSLTPVSLVATPDGQPLANSPMLPDGVNNFPNLSASCLAGPAALCSDYNGAARAASGLWTAGPFTFGSVPSTRPIIIQQPQSVTILPGQTATFSVIASGSAPLAYQWQVQSPGGSGFTNIPYGTSATYTTPAMSLSDTGTQFQCVVTNSTGTATSLAATLTVSSSSGTVLPTPTLTLPSYLPVNAQITAGYPSGYTLSAFQWSITPYTGPMIPNNNPYPSQAHAMSRAASANFATAGSKADLGPQGLVPGIYQISVKAVDANNDVSAPAQAVVTLIVSDLSGARVYPNPWRTDKHSALPITFDHLALGSTIKLFTVSGHWVKTLKPVADTITWDLTNDSGDKVASGLYVYLITVGDVGAYGGSGQQRRGQIAVIH